MVRWCLRETGNREVAADLSAEVFAAALISARRLYCRSNQSGSTGSPELEPSEVIRAVGYRDAPSCHLLTSSEAAGLQAAQGKRFRTVLRERFPAIYRAVYRAERYVPGSIRTLTAREDETFEALGHHTSAPARAGPARRLAMSPRPHGT